MKLILNIPNKLPCSDELKSKIEKIDIVAKLNLNFLFDDNYYHNVSRLHKKKKNLHPKVLIVIGIGGSNLGCMAIQQAMFGEFYNERDRDSSLDTLDISLKCRALGMPGEWCDFVECKAHRPKVYYADTTDTESTRHILNVVERHLKNGDEILLNVISKSGKTTETIANFRVFLNLLKKYKPDFHNNIVVTTDAGSALYNYAKNNDIDTLEIPAHVGGRYSVFTAVGIFPLLFMNVDVEKIIAGARKSVCDGLKADGLTLSRALLLLDSYDKGVKLHDLFLFSKRLYHYGYWYRQLMAESIGKEFDLNGQQVNIGITPTISIGSVDLHSVAQLYLSDLGNRLTTFVRVKNLKDNILIPDDIELESIIPDISKNNMAELINIICHGTELAYKKKDKPFCIIELEYLTEYEIGYLMQSNMIEVALFGFLLNIDPFNQPNVELYKTEVRNMLRQKNG